MPAACARASFSWRLKVPRSLAISAALAADFSTSISELRHGMAGLHFAQDQRGVAQDAGQRIVEIQGHGAGQLQRAIQLLLVRQPGLSAGWLGFGSGEAAGPKKLEHEIRLARPR